MNYRTLGKTGLSVSEIGFGGEWLERHEVEESVELIKYAGSKGINIIDCWMPDPKSRDIIGEAIKDSREKWFVQGHIGSIFLNGQYNKSRDLKLARPSFEDLLKRLQTDYIDLGMIHYVDSEEEWEQIQTSEYLEFILEQKKNGVIKHIGMSSHNPKVALKAAQTDYIEMIMFSINPAFDMLPSNEKILDVMSADTYDEKLSGVDAERAEFYRLCEERNIGLTVMKPYAGGRLFDANRSPFGVALTPVQCIHYALSIPAVGAVMCGYDTKEQVDGAVAYETTAEEEKEFASLLANAPHHSFIGQCTYCGHCKPCPVNIDIAMVNKFYDLAVMQDTMPESIRSHYEQLEHHASECIGCKGCETRCPFGVKIADKMVKAAEKFGM